MTKRRKILLAFAGALILGVGLWAVFTPKPEPDPEPSYGGKTLSEWLADGGNPRRADAIRHIGTNAIPHLLNWIQYQQLPWRNKLDRFCQAHLKRGLPVDKDQKRRDDATYAFHYLGKDALGAIPELKRQALVSKPRNPQALIALAYLGKDGFPVLMEAFTNQEPVTRLAAVLALDALGTNAEPAIPLVVNLLKDSDFRVAGFSINYLARNALAPEQVVPILTRSLTKGLQVKNEPWIRSTLWELGGYGVQARPAVPALLMCLNSTNVSLRLSASAALQKIDPEALKRATQK